MALVALPAAIVLGAIAELAAGLTGRATRGERRWWRGVTGVGADIRRLARGRRNARASVVETLGAAGSVVGSGLGAAAAIGLVPGSAALLYLALAAAAVGAHVAAPGRGGESAATRDRWLAALAEPGFVVALGALFARWRAADLVAVRGTQSVLGPGFGLGPGPAVGGLILAGLVVLVTGAMRLPRRAEPVRRGLQSRGAGASLLVSLSRWAAAGATALVVAMMLAGGRLLEGAPVTEQTRFLGAAAVAALVLGAAGAALRSLPGRWAAVATFSCLVPAAAAGALVALA